MTNQPLFSVLIANYNNGKYLMDAIESVRQQTYTNWEIILVDDGSTDNSHELYKELEKNERIHIFLNDQNRGCGYTKHRCAELANGEICGFLDPDDALIDDALEVMVDVHSLDKSVSLVFSLYYRCDSDLKIIATSTHPAQKNGITPFLECHDVMPTHFTTFKLKKYNETAGINTILLRAVDHELYFLLEEVGKVAFVNKPLYLYRHDTGLNISLGNNMQKARFWNFIVVSDACKRQNYSIEKYAFNVLREYVEEEKSIAANLAADQVRSSITYRLGSMLLKPIKFIVHLFNK